MQKNDSPDIFEHYDKLISLYIEGEERRVPENNSILRCLQYLNIEAMSDADLCWNGECLDCQVWIDNSGKEKAVMSCRTTASDGMKIVRMCRELADRMGE
ncbi:MAG TPA: 2Fe-2S iron-sulfur cluster-binding protein [Pyrinomonadaceae bacterium]|nr:2Fe-2S iron-sulfur cluster-binding protein [Pyrinomonadaceae bacterium]